MKKNASSKSKNSKTQKNDSPVASSDLEKIKSVFLHQKKKIFGFFLLTNVLLFLAFAVVGGKLFYPYHFMIGIGLVLVSVTLSLYRTYASYRTFKTFRIYAFAEPYFAKWRWRVLGSIFIIMTIVAFFTVFPFFGNPFQGLSIQEIDTQVEQESEYALLVMDRLEISGHDLLDTIENDVENRSVLLAQWHDFLRALHEAEILIQRHRYFGQVHPIRLPQAHARSFITAYSLYMKKQEMVHSLIVATKENDRIKKLFNENVDFLSNAYVYTDLASHFYTPETLLKVNAWRAYLEMLNLRDKTEYGEAYEILKIKSEESYSYFNEHISETFIHSSDVARQAIEIKMFDAWFPVQKGIANTMGDTFLSERKHEKLITTNQIQTMGHAMEPGDIMVQRRNWYLSNVGIPGFWTHAAIYTGDLEYMNKYFVQEFPYQNAENFTDYLQNHFPEVYQAYQKTDKSGYPMAMIEARAPGVELYSLEESANADSVGVMRPKVSRLDKMLALFRAYENFGKPYDYNFDFETRDTLVCSEVVYDAYLPEAKNGLHLALSLTTGRKVYTPTDFVKKFYEERGTDKQELDFVYFLDGNETLSKAFPKGETEFMTTWTRQKFDWTL